MDTFSKEQEIHFVQHLTNSHSWYKHLSLLNGGDFIIIIDEMAGTNYPLHHPKLPFGNTFEGYRKAFGQLNYYWKNYDDIYYSTDNRSKNYSETEIIKEYKRVAKTKIFPYISNDFIESINFHSTDFEKIISGHEHDESNNLTEIFNLYKKLDDYWNNIFTEEERNLMQEDKINTINLKNYFLLEEEINNRLSVIKQKETDKLFDAIKKLT